ncbi:MAG: hypothetical protein U0835_06355 [Isosphaeraceae bacterium]
MPLSPYPHEYLAHPSALVWSVALPLPLNWLWSTPRLPPSVRWLLILAALLHSVPRVPGYWRPDAVFPAVRDLWLGRIPKERPPGCVRGLEVRKTPPKLEYAWEDYRDLIEYLRTQTNRRTRVAGFFRGHPFPTVNGPAGRLPLFPSPGGILWLRFAAPELQAPFEEALTRPGDAVVVWAPEARFEPRLKLERLEAVIRRLYRPEARFGIFEVWRRKPDPTEPGPTRSGVDAAP